MAIQNGPASEAQENQGVGATARAVAEHASAITRLELELAGLELRGKAISLGLGAGLVAGAGVFALYVVGFAAASGAAGIATVLPVWAALLIVAGILALLAVILVLAARAAFRRATPPVPDGAIREAKLTQAAIRS